MRPFRSLGGLFGLTEPRSHMAIMSVVFVAIGITLCFQPHRYTHTPSYGNLLTLLPATAWGVIYLVAATLKLASIANYRHRPLVVITHTVSIALLLSWWAAFVIRYVTDPGTTIVNVASWGVYLYLVVRSALMMDDLPTGRRRDQ